MNTSVFSRDLHGSGNWSEMRNSADVSPGRGVLRGPLRTPERDSSMHNEGMTPHPPSSAKRSSAKPKVPKVSITRPYNMTRPPLLEELEKFISAELEYLSHEEGDDPSTDDWLSIRRLRIYREAFQKFIDEFNIYKPILTAIKYEYESMFEYFSVKARSQMSARAEFVTFEREHSQKLARKDEQHIAELSSLQQKLAAAEKKCEEKDKELQMMNAQVDILKISATKAEAVAEDVKKSCITLTNALKRNEEEKKELMDIDTSRKNEILALKVAFHKSSNDLEKMRLQVHDMEANQTSLVSHDKLERHISKIQELREQLAEKDEAQKNLIQRYSLLKNSIEKACNDNKTQIALKRGSAYLDTGKFDWSKKDVLHDVEKALAIQAIDPRHVIEALINQVVELNREIEEKLAGILVDGSEPAEMNDGNDGELATDHHGDEDSVISPWLHFQGLGLGPNIPVFLRTNGNVCNLNFTKKECEVYVNDIWNAKAEYEESIRLKNKLSGDEDEEADAENGVRDNKVHLADFFKIFLERKFKTTSKSIEFSYNFMSALKKYDFDSDCALFLMIMNKDLPEDIRSDQLILLASILEECQREELQVRGQIEGHLPIASFIRVIKKVIPTKGAFAFRRLEKALHLECKGRKYALYKELLEEDENGNQGRFCETLRMQHVTECTAFANHVLDCIDQYARDEDKIQAVLNTEESAASVIDVQGNDSATISTGTPATHLPLSRFREALVYADPDNTRAGLNKLLARGCNMSIEEMLVIEVENLSFPVADFKENLKTGMIKKSHPSSSGDRAGGGKLYG